MTYGKETSREYLDWLDRELTRLEHASKQDRDAAGDHASTSTMITWHAVERIYHDMPPAMKAALEASTGKQVRTMEQFKTYWRSQMEDLRRVQQTAVETKHPEFDEAYRPHVERLETTVSASDASPMYPGERIGLTFTPKIIIEEEERRVRTLDLLRGVHTKLVAFVDEWGIDKDPST